MPDRRPTCSVMLDTWRIDNCSRKIAMRTHFPSVVPAGYGLRPFLCSWWTVVLLAVSMLAVTAKSTWAQSGQAAPPQPQVLAATPGPGNVSLTWYSSTTVQEVTAQRTTDPNNGPWQTIGSYYLTEGGTNYSYYSDSGLTNGVTYYYRIATDYYTASGRSPLSPWSDPVSATPNYKDCNPGLRADYYHDAGFTNFAGTRNEPGINFSYADNGGSPGFGLGNGSGWAVRWHGLLTPPANGSYVFHTHTDDGVRLWINGQLLINDWQNGTQNDQVSSPIYLYGGSISDIRVDYYENGEGPANAKLSWSGPVGSDQIIGPAYLSEGTQPLAPTNVAVVNGNGQAILSWSASSGATSYSIYRSSSQTGNFTFVGSTSNTTYTDAPLSNGLLYYYTIYANNACGGNGSNTVGAAPYALTQVTLNPASVYGGYHSTGHALFTGQPPAGTVVALRSDSGVASVPQNVTVPAGGVTDIPFDIITSLVSASTNVNITAACNGASQSAMLTINPITLTGLSLNPLTVYEGSSSTGTVTLNTAPSAAVTIALSSDNAAASVPASVTVPANATSASFTVSTSNVTTDTHATITAAFNGGAQSAGLDIYDFKIIGVSVSTPVSGGTSAPGTVIFNRSAPAGGATVSLSSSNTAAAVPTSVQIPAYASSGSFTVSTTQVAVDTSGPINATFKDVTLPAPLLVTGPRVTGIVGLTPNPVIGGSPANGTVTGTVTLDRLAPPGGVSISLASNSAAAPVPVTLSIAGGSKQGTFTINTTQVTVSTPASLTASLNGTTATGTLTVNPYQVSLVALSVGSVVGGNSVSGTVSLNTKAPSGGIMVALSSSDTAASVPTTVTIPSGATSVGFNLTTVAVAVDTPLNIIASLNGRSYSAPLTVTAPRLALLVLNPSTVIGGPNPSPSPDYPTTSTGTVTITSAAPVGGLPIGLGSDTAVAQVPGNVQIPAGGTRASFTVTTQPVATTPVTATITASLNSASMIAPLLIKPLPIVAMPIFTPATNLPGTPPVYKFVGSVGINISSVTQGALDQTATHIYYTTDGSDPNASSPPYTTPLHP